MDNLSTLWLIPARGGSKGIPRKNIKPFCGESLVSRSLKQALECASKKDIVLVSTDDEEIKREAEKVGIEVPFIRPDELASDQASSYSVMLHSIEEFKKRGKTFQRMVLLQPTSPLRKIEDIRGAVNLWNKELDMVVSVCESKVNPYFNAFETDESGYLKLSKGNGEFSRRQDAPKVWEYNGAVYVITIDSLLKEPLSKFKKTKPFIMPASRSVDLDSEEDWLIAEFLYRRMHECK